MQEIQKELEKIYEMIKNLYGVDELVGCTEDEIEYIKGLFGTISPILEEFYRVAAKTEKLHKVQDIWMLPEHFKKYDWLKKSECLILLNENQGVCQAGIKREDLKLENPPVYVSTDDKEWVLCADSLSNFLAAALGYEASFGFEYTPEEFYWITKEELLMLDEKMTKLPYEMKNWLYDIHITLYSNSPDNMVAVMDCNGDLQVVYGAAGKESYEVLMEVMEGIGEAM